MPADPTTNSPHKHADIPVEDLEHLTVGKMAELNCVSTRTLRVYDEIGLLVPASRSEETGYRYYTIEQCGTLDAIQRLQEFGFSLSEIKDALDQQDPMALYKDLDEKSEEVGRRISELRRMKYEISQLSQRCLITQSEIVLETPRLEVLPERRAIRFDLNERSLPNSSDAQESLRRWQLAVCHIKHHMLDMGCPPMYFGNVACCIPSELLKQGVYDYTQALVFISEREHDFTDKTEVIPLGRYMTMYCKDLNDDGPLRENVCMPKMMKAVEESGFKIAGDYIGEVVLDTELFGFTGREELVKMQVRVE